MIRTYELRAKTNLTKLAGKVTLDGESVELTHGGATVVLLDEHKNTVLIAMPPPAYQFFEVPTEGLADK